MKNEKLMCLYDFQNRSGTVFHPCGTCKMGSDPASSVVDSKLNVHNISNLRVVDASIFPNITSANTNSPTIMIAHKAADMILENWVYEIMSIESTWNFFDNISTRVKFI